MPARLLGIRGLNMAQPVNWQHPFNRGLGAWWKATPMGARGARLHDLVRYKHATLTNGATWAGSRGGPAYGSLSLSGSNQYATAAALSGLGTTNSALMLAVVNITTLGGFKGVLHNRTGGGVQGIIFSDNTGIPLSYMWEGTIDEYSANNGMVMTTGSWAVVAVHISSTAATVHFQHRGGALRTWTNTKTHNAKNLNVAWDLGRDSFASNAMTGYLAEARIQSPAPALAQVPALVAEMWRPYSDTLNWLSTRYYSVPAAAPGGGSPWHYYAQMRAA